MFDLKPGLVPTGRVLSNALVGDVRQVTSADAPGNDPLLGTYFLRRRAPKVSRLRRLTRHRLFLSLFIYARQLLVRDGTKTVERIPSQRCDAIAFLFTICVPCVDARIGLALTPILVKAPMITVQALHCHLGTMWCFKYTDEHGDCEVYIRAPQKYRQKEWALFLAQKKSSFCINGDEMLLVKNDDRVTFMHGTCANPAPFPTTQSFVVESEITRELAEQLQQLTFSSCV